MQLPKDLTRNKLLKFFSKNSIPHSHHVIVVDGSKKANVALSNELHEVFLSYNYNHAAPETFRGFSVIRLDEFLEKKKVRKNPYTDKPIYDGVMSEDNLTDGDFLLFLYGIDSGDINTDKLKPGTRAFDRLIEKIKNKTDEWKDIDDDLDWGRGHPQSNEGEIRKKALANFYVNTPQTDQRERPHGGGYDTYTGKPVWDNIYNILVKGLSERELRAMQWENGFEAIGNMSNKASRADLADELIGIAGRGMIVEALLKYIKAVNPNRYHSDGPYFS